MTAATLNTNYAIANDSEYLSFPSLQATEYKPRSLKEKIGIGCSDDSLQYLDEKAIELLNLNPVECQFSAEDAGVVHVPAAVRWVLLNMPKLYVHDPDGSIEHLTKGMRLTNGKKTCARLFLVAIVGDQLVMNGDQPQVFRLNLKGLKTNLIGKQIDAPGSGTIAALNRGLTQHYKVKGQLLHLVSIELLAEPRKFTAKSGDSSLGVYFTLGEGARPLSEANQKKVFDLLQDPEIKEAIAHPYGVIAKPQPKEEVYEYEYSPDDEIPY